MASFCRPVGAGGPRVCIDPTWSFSLESLASPLRCQEGSVPASHPSLCIPYVVAWRRSRLCKDHAPLACELRPGVWEMPLLPAPWPPACSCRPGPQTVRLASVVIPSLTRKKLHSPLPGCLQRPPARLPASFLPALVLAAGSAASSVACTPSPPSSVVQPLLPLAPAHHGLQLSGQGEPLHFCVLE